MTRQQIKDRFHSPNQPGIMHAMFDEVIDFALDNYANENTNIIYVVIGQTQMTNFIMEVFSTKQKAENFIKSKEVENGWYYSPYIEEYKLN